MYRAPHHLCLIASALCLWATGASALAQHESHQDHGKQAEKHDEHGQDHADHAAAWTTDPYPLDTCAVTGEKLGDKPVVKIESGREIKFCCNDCVKTFEGEPAKYTEALDKKIVAQQLQYYPLETCVSSGEKLGSMGEPVNKVYGNRLVRFCCNSCAKEFAKDPAAGIAKLDKAVIERQSAAYTLSDCPVSGHAVSHDGKPIVAVFGNRMVKFCCQDCVAEFKADPVKYFAKLDEMLKAAPAEKKQGGG